MHYLSAFAVGHAPGVSCARRAPASCSGKGFSVRPWWKGHARVANAGAHLLEYDDFTVRREALVGVANLDEIDVPARRFLCSACKCTCTSLPLRETRWTGDTNVDIGRAGCRLLGRLQQCLPRSDVSFEFGLARARGQQHCPQHREHLLSSRRNSDGPRFFTFWHTGSSEFLFRASGRHPNVWILSVEALFLSCLTTQTAGLTVTQLHASRMIRTIWPLLHQVRCSTQSFRKRAHRWGKVVSFPTAFGRTSNHTSSDSDMCTKKTNFVLQACACFFFLRCAVLNAWNGWLCFAGSAALRARSGVSVLLLGDRGAP